MLRFQCKIENSVDEEDYGIIEKNDDCNLDQDTKLKECVIMN